MTAVPLSLDQPPEPPDAEFETPHDRTKANKMLWVRRRVVAELERVKAHVADERAELTAYLEGAEADAAKRLADIDSHLAQFHRAAIATGAPITLPLPNGTLKTHDQPPEWHWPEGAVNAELLLWLANNRAELYRPSQERVTTSPPAPDKNAIKAAVKEGSFVVNSDGELVDFETGEAVPGVIVETRGPRFTVEVTP